MNAIVKKTPKQKSKNNAKPPVAFEGLSTPIENQTDNSHTAVSLSQADELRNNSKNAEVSPQASSNLAESNEGIGATPLIIGGLVLLGGAAAAAGGGGGSQPSPTPPPPPPPPPPPSPPPPPPPPPPAPPPPVADIPVIKFAEAQKINGIDISRKYTRTDVNDTFGFVWEFSLSGFYFANGNISALPVVWPDNAVNADPALVGKYIDVYISEFSYSLSNISATKNESVISTSSPRTLELADFNNDGLLDVFIGDQGYDASPYPGAQNSLLLGTQSGFTKGNLPIVLDFTHSSAVADIDSDGDLDIFVGNTGNVEPYFLLNDGKANFTRVDNLITGIPNIRNQYTGSEIGDIDKDGRVDLVLGGFNTGTEVLSWDGAKFVPSYRIYQADDATRTVTQVSIKDIDNDKIPEVILLSTNQNNISFYDESRIDIFKFKDGSFEKSQSIIASDTAWNKNLYFSDFNNDGWVDIASIGKDHAIFINEKGNFKIEQYEFQIPPYAMGVEMWDLNNDGRLDILYADGGPHPSPGVQLLNVFVMFG